MTATTVRVQYFEGCPNWKTAQQRLGEALTNSGLEGKVEVSYQLVETPEDAERVGFHGSPTILIDDRDPWAAEGTAIGLSCRIYRTDAGAEGSPSVQQLVDVLTNGS